MEGRAVRIASFFRELKRRRVIRAGTVYVVTAWGLTLGAAELFPFFGAPSWAVRLFAVVAALGLPIVLLLAWLFQLTSAGLERDLGVEEPHALDRNPPVTTVSFGSQGVVRTRWSGPGGTVHERAFDRGFVLGRDSDCEIRFDDPLVSRRHASVSFSDGVWSVTDLASRNGTFIGDRRIESSPLPAQGILKLSEGGPEIAIEVRTKPSVNSRDA
jgi:hypothetical protein